MIYRLHGTIQPYAWGGYDYIPTLLRQRPDGNPVAELWFGDHPQAPTQIEDHDWQPLNIWLANRPEALSTASRKRYGNRLPFLLKILDVRLPLSIQLHPDKKQAEAGYAHENAAGIALTSPERNYQDDNHKPESMIALSDFWLLHGFAASEVINERLASRPSLAPIVVLIQEYGLHEAYARIMTASQATLAQWLHPLLDLPAPEQVSNNPDYWLHYACTAMGISRDHLDPGLLSFYLFNIVRMQTGEGIFQRARLPHAYLRGQNIELMAASNNVLRAGLTPKHIDIAELLRIVDTEAVQPAIISAPSNNAPYEYPAPVDDYTLLSTYLSAGERLPYYNAEAAIILNLSGKLHVTQGTTTLIIESGEAVFLTPDGHSQLLAEGDCYVILASNR